MALRSSDRDASRVWAPARMCWMFHWASDCGDGRKTGWAAGNGVKMRDPPLVKTSELCGGLMSCLLRGSLQLSMYFVLYMFDSQA